MTREALETAASHLRTASDHATDEPGDRLADLAGQLEDLATSDRGVDHGRLARVQNALVDLRETVGAPAADAIDDADDAIDDFRQTLDGV
jgi:hypothetical protein